MHFEERGGHNESREEVRLGFFGWTIEGGAFEALTRVAGIVASESDGSEENMWDLAESAVEMVGKKTKLLVTSSCT